MLKSRPVVTQLEGEIYLGVIMAELDLSTLNQTVKEQSVFVSQMMSEMSKMVVGQKEMIEGMTIGLLTGGHILLEGVPGLAKTLTISTMADTISLDFKRIQFTPDLLPTDLVGTMIFNPKTGDFTVKKGPIFSNIVLADEINRAPAKVQSALLEAMAEKQVTIGEESYKLDHPFLVLATQNPLEQEGTYPLPEAQMDRFMFKINVTYPTKAEELEIVTRMGNNQKPELKKVISKEQLIKTIAIVDQIYVDQKVKNYIVDLIMATRSPTQYGLGRLDKLIAVGGSPRASLSLIRAAKAHAFLRGRGFVTIEDIKAVVYKVLRHRLILSYEAEAENLKQDDIIKEVLSAIEVSG
jgi:MoxR-like ATPase